MSLARAPKKSFVRGFAGFYAMRTGALSRPGLYVAGHLLALRIARTPARLILKTSGTLGSQRRLRQYQLIAAERLRVVQRRVRSRQQVAKRGRFGSQLG